MILIGYDLNLYKHFSLIFSYMHLQQFGMKI